MDDILKGIVFADTNKTKSMAALNGGWEGWLQIEVALAAIASGKYTQVVREGGYGDGKLRWDFVLTPNTNVKFGVELKAESAGQAYTIANAWWADVTKLGNQMQGFRVGYAYLITVSADATAGANQLLNQSGGEIEMIKQQDAVSLYRYILRL